MKFNIRDIGPSGVRVRRNLSDRDVRGLLRAASVEVRDAPVEARFDLHLARAESTVVVSGNLAGRFSVQCVRCLGPAAVTVSASNVRLTFFPRRTGPDSPRDEQLSADDLDVYEHDDETVDLGPVIREHLVLAIPISPLCREGCSGLCSRCGADLNDARCGCDRGDRREPPWAVALSDIKLKTTPDGAGG